MRRAQKFLTVGAFGLALALGSTSASADPRVIVVEPVPGYRALVHLPLLGGNAPFAWIGLSANHKYGALVVVGQLPGQYSAVSYVELQENQAPYRGVYLLAGTTEGKPLDRRGLVNVTAETGNGGYHSYGYVTRSPREYVDLPLPGLPN